MEHDRFAINSKLYILGMICLLCCLGLFFFSLFILPYLIWELNYDIPEFVVSFLYFLQKNYQYSVEASKVLVWFAFFIPCVITGIISYFVSNRIESNIYKEETIPDENEEGSFDKETMRQFKESVVFGFKILGLMIIIVILILLLQVFVQLTA